MRYQTILFDLDGTLTDPKVGITRSVQIALARFGIEIADRDALIPYIGPPLIGSFMRLHGLSHDDARRAVDYYREHFATIGLYENELYPGIDALLEALQTRGCALVLATSKPTVFAERILDHFGLSRYFELVVGSNLDHTRVEKTEIIAHALAQRTGIVPEQAVMVGDREHDVIGARNNGVAAIGVAYGYGGADELHAAGVVAVAHTVADLAALLLAE